VHIDWGTLAAIAAVAAAATVTVVLLVSFAVVGLSGPSRRRVDSAGDGGVSAPHSVAGTALAGLCLLAAGLIVGYGLYLIVS
jgi:ABC-type sulfate transport system permease component